MADHPSGPVGRVAKGHGGLSKSSEQRLRSLSDRMATGVEEPGGAAGGRHHFRLYLVTAVVVVVVAGLAVQWLRPLPTVTFHSALSGSIRLPGTLPTPPWPTTGSAALSVDEIGTLGQAGSTQPVPIASIAKVLTAYVILNDHPLQSDSNGPTIAVSPAIVAAYQQGEATQQSEVPVASGETITELQALQGLLVASGNDMATLLADWDAGTTTAFVAKMNSAARIVGLVATHITDPSGLDPATLSTPADLVRLGQAAMAIPAFAQVVDMAQLNLPLGGVVYNFDYLLGHDGFVGIKTGSDSAAGGCFLFEAQKTVLGKNVTVVGAVLGQGGTSTIEGALTVADLLSDNAFSSIALVPLVAPGHLVGRLVAPWGASVPVTTSSSGRVLGWPGLTVKIHTRLWPLSPPISAGERVGALTVYSDGRPTEVEMQSSQQLAGPSALWRLTRF